MPVDKNYKLFHNFFSLGFIQVVNSALQLLVVPYMISTVGADGFGMIAVAQVVMYCLATFTDYGFNQTGTRSVAIHQNNSKKVAETFFTIFFTKLFLCIVAFVFLLLLVFFVPFFENQKMLYLMSFSFVLGQTLLMNWFFQGVEKMWFIALATLAGRLLFVLLVFAFIKESSDVSLFLLFMGLGNIIAGIITIALALRIFKLEFVKPSFSNVLQELKDGWHFTVPNLAMNICHYANIFILRLFTNDLVVGYFSVAEKVYFAVKQVLIVFLQSVYPRVCQLAGKGKEQVNAFFRAVYIPFLGLVIAGSILLIVLSPQVLSFFSGKEAFHSVFTLQMLSIVLIVICMSIPFTLLLLANNQKKSYFGVYTLGAVLNVVANIILAYFFQAIGTIIAIFVTEIFVTLGVIYEWRRFDQQQKESNIIADAKL